LAKGKRVLPYFAQFDLRVQEVSSNQSRVCVTTTSAWVRDGKEIGIHGGWAWHTKAVPPIHQEETNIVLRVQAQLLLMETGDFSPLPATQDSNNTASYPTRQLMEIDPHAKKDLGPVLGVETNGVHNAP
jgi:hypothetical protein